MMYIALDFLGICPAGETPMQCIHLATPWTQKYHVMNIMNSREEIRLVEMHADLESNTP